MNKDLKRKFMRQLIEAGTDVEVISDLVDDIFDIGYETALEDYDLNSDYDNERGEGVPWEDLD